jgi:hypothetical protein
MARSAPSASSSLPDRQRHAALALLGEIQIGRGEDAEGAASLERARSMPWSPAIEGRSWIDTNALLLLSGAYERLGEREKALERLDLLLRCWERADRDLPGLAGARALRRRLAAGTAQATQR